MRSSLGTKTAAAALVAVIALVACGGEDEASNGIQLSESDATSATTPPTASTIDPAGAKRKFVRDAEAICFEANNAVDAIPVPTNDGQFAEAIDESVAIYTGMIVELRALTPPPGDESTVNALWAMLEESQAAFHEASVALRAGDPRQDELLSTAATDEDSFNTNATAYGLYECGT